MLAHIMLCKLTINELKISEFNSKGLCALCDVLLIGRMFIFSFHMMAAATAW